MTTIGPRDPSRCTVQIAAAPNAVRLMVKGACALDAREDAHQILQPIPDLEDTCLGDEDKSEYSSDDDYDDPQGNDNKIELTQEQKQLVAMVKAISMQQRERTERRRRRNTSKSSRRF